MFRFKQFEIQQQHCAQKVTEVACVLGAITPIPETCERILDAGSGTGLLALMLAQRSQAAIDALELDHETALQGQANIQASAFGHRIRYRQGDVLAFNSDDRYDLIVCNPPFYTGQLPSSSLKKRLAWHQQQAFFPHWWQHLLSLLRDDGLLSLLLPAESGQLIQEAVQTAGYSLHSEIRILHTVGHPVRLTIWVIRKGLGNTIFRDFYLRNADGKRSKELSELMQDFYL